MELIRPVVVLDLETTGTWIEKDRIIEIGLIRCSPDGTEDRYEKRVNPGMDIPEVVSEITGITNEAVKDCPYFRDIAKEVDVFIRNCDLAGFNIERFDLPVLIRELGDNGIGFSMGERTVYDAQKIYHIHERRDLTAAYSFYCHKNLKDAHSALADAQATYEVLLAQLKKYGEGSQALEALKDFDYKKRLDFFDAQRKFRWWNGELYMMFGKYARKATLKEVARKDKGYLEWILSQDFSEEVKELVEGALEGNFPLQEHNSCEGKG